MKERERVIRALVGMYSWPELMRRSGQLVWPAYKCKSKVLSAAARLFKDAADETGRGDGTLKVRRVR